MPAVAALPSSLGTKRGECDVREGLGGGSGMDSVSVICSHCHHPCCCWYDTGCPLGGLAEEGEGRRSWTGSGGSRRRRGVSLGLCMLLVIRRGGGVPRGGLVAVSVTRYCFSWRYQVAESHPVYVCDKEFGLV
jgi:hypothetical protein